MNKPGSIIYILPLLILFSCKSEHRGPVFNANTRSSFTAPSTKLWQDQKLEMMIHFGLYSMLGGVYNGQNISNGYSEQIMANAPIPAEDYKKLAASFNPTFWNADSIVTLAIRSGMKSIIITAKHHDGFCLYDTKVTDFNVVKATPYKRDILKDLSEACRKQGLSFGVYFSLIDWNAPQGAIRPSFNNADSIPDALHQNNLIQIKELCNNYSPAEIWFDMGNLSKTQSKEIRDAVKSLQPDCMIGGRLGNGQGDFAVLGDNEASEYRMESPWQSVNSIFDNTWGYRSWQSTANLKDKVQEHLTKFVNTVLRGGNYMLNIGPKGDGSIVDFERNVLLGIGQWINAGNGDAIYNTKPCALGEKSWGGFTFKPGSIYAIIKSAPDEGKLLFYGLNNQITSVSPLLSPGIQLLGTKEGNTYSYDLGLMPLKFEPASIVEIKYDGSLDIIPAKQTYVNNANQYELSYYNANQNWAYDGANYYTTVPSVISESWDIATPKDKAYTITLYYTQQEKNKSIKLSINGHDEILDLSKYKTFKQEKVNGEIIPSTIYTQGPYNGIAMTSHPGPLNWAVPGSPWGKEQKLWPEVKGLEQSNIVPLHPDPFQSYYYLINFLGTKAKRQIVALGADDAFMAFFNGRLVYSAGYPPSGNNTVFLDLPFEQETNTLIMKHMNVRGDFKTFYSTMLDQITFEKEAGYAILIPKKTNHIALALANPDHPSESLSTPNLRIVISEKNK